jgi:TetR/AcrR family transcriptional regulator, fatty acid metabolism regulator protein
LIDAATWVFARKGYRRSGISDIIARAGVARGTFYLHFASKDRILLAVLDNFHDRTKRAFEALDAAATAARSLGPRAVLEASFQCWLEFFTTHRDATRVVLREARAIDSRFEQALGELRQSALTRFATRFRKFQDEGLASRSLDPELAAHFQLGILDELLNWCVPVEGDVDIAKLASQFADFEWNGIRPDRLA